MPVVSTLANVSLLVAHKKKAVMEGVSCCKCKCSCHQQPYPLLQQQQEQQQQQQYAPIHAWWGQSGLNDFSNWAQKINKRHCQFFSDVQRTPFCAFNGKAYAVPLSMVNQFNAALQYEQSGAVSRDWGSSKSLLQLPGVVWRHDPYSAKVLCITPESLACQQESSALAEQGESSPAFGGGCHEEVDVAEALHTKRMEVAMAEEQMVVDRLTNVVNESDHQQLGAYGNTAWNPMCVSQPSSAMLGTMLCFSAAAAVGSCSSGVYSDISMQQSYASPFLTHHHQHYQHNSNGQRGFCTAIAATTDDAMDQRKDSQASSMPVVPSARPFPFLSGRRVVVRSIPPPPLPSSQQQQQQQQLTVNNSSTNISALNAMVVASSSADFGYESLPPVSQCNSLVSCTQRLRCTHNGGGERSVDDSAESLLATLSLFRSLPPLFTDLAAHTNRRPSAAGKTACNDSQLRADDVRYVYLVAHRCRRTVCAAPVLHEIGAMVVLEGDMGIEMGGVRVVLPLEDFDKLDTAGLARYGFPTDHDVVTAAVILRPATAEETRHYTETLCHLAKDLLEFLQHRLNPSNFMDCHVENMEFLDCEFQADCKKIYVYYRAKKRVLFRELAQYLHSFYRCRIWLHEVGKGAQTLVTESLQ